MPECTRHGPVALAVYAVACRTVAAENLRSVEGKQDRVAGRGCPFLAREDKRQGRGECRRYRSSYVDSESTAVYMLASAAHFCLLIRELQLYVKAVLLGGGVRRALSICRSAVRKVDAAVACSGCRTKLSTPSRRGSVELNPSTPRFGAFSDPRRAALRSPGKNLSSGQFRRV